MSKFMLVTGASSSFGRLTAEAHSYAFPASTCTQPNSPHCPTRRSITPSQK